MGCGFDFISDLIYFCLHRRLRFPIFVLVFLFLAAFSGAELVYGEFDHSLWDQILKKHVRAGFLDYQGCLKDRVSLEQYLNQAGQVSPDETSKFSREEWIAFLINIYNAGIVRVVLDIYPIQTVKPLDQSIRASVVQIGNEKFGLLEIRDQILRRNFRDERVLLTLVSARMDSPQLMNEAYNAKTLEDQLNRASFEFVADFSRNRIEPGKNKIYLSRLFYEYGSDFILNFGGASANSKFTPVENAVISFLIHHLKDPEKRLYLDSGRYKVEYLPEDSRLNDIKFKVNSSVDRSLKS